MTTRLTGPLCVAILAAGTVGALAQTGTLVVREPQPLLVQAPTAQPGAPQAVVVTPAQGVLVQRYMVSAAPAVVVSSGYTPVVGAVLPETVQLQTFDATQDYGGFNAPAYRYVVLQDQGTVLVEPGTRKIIHVIPQ
ncbi:DUF1236 domain-containing protein [Aquabacter sp. P-9]|uniref:DUF1236 domain-containing protein n=1 Tax=Aquabacter sediminis TaxID=3029197 RepID=UPI00237D4522|nr:DUF1236 domain-containing protein [Aquabacter sp. P-9]MDE1569820.1 DUF1236 domain-containing protein [Aquabacter sp. P-9]